MADIDDSTLYEIITGRVEPHIYSFETNTLPNMLKVGDTYRPVEERLDEWRRHYKDLTEVSRYKATVNDDVFFRDHSVHKYLENNGVVRSPLDESKGIYSQEFFHDIGEPEVANAVKDVIDSYGTPGKYAYYDHLKDKVEQRYARDRDFSPRGNQQEVINNFTNAVNSGRTNLLMYAVMRFGKSITSMWCARQIDSKLTIVVSAKADVRSEWKQTVESHKDFTGYRFIDGADITADMKLSEMYGQSFQTGGGETETCTNIVIFFTLQDLAGSTDEIKARHHILESADPDLLIIDETHFGARAQVLGKILAGIETTEADDKALKDTDGVDDLGRISKLTAINARVKLHLSGTPYRILMGSEFEQDDIIAFVQFSNIYEDKVRWREEHLDQDEWRNPYYGFPQMIRFAFNPNESSRKKLESIPGSKPAEIFAPVSTSKTGDYETFKHEAEAIELLQILDGTKQDTQLLGILDHESVKSGKLAHHIVIVLPNKASCDAFEKLVSERGDLFKNLSEYNILNLAGHNTPFRSVDTVKSTISKFESEGKKTMSLTVNKLLTGVTIPQWDTMIYLKAGISPQEYDQAIFRLQSPWIKEYIDETTGEAIKYDMKPQTLLVDLDPTRLFNTIGNENIEKFIERELRVSPVLALNAENNKLVEIEASRIIDAVRKYSSERSIAEDVNEISVDVSLRNNEEIFNVISKLSELSSRGGLDISPTDDDGQEVDGELAPDSGDDGSGEEGQSTGNKPSESNSKDDEGIKTFEKQFRAYYVRILLFAFLSDTNEKSLQDVIDELDANDDNRRIAKSLGLKKEELVMLRANINWSVLSSLDYKIQNSDFRSNDDTITLAEHIEIAINKFGKISDSEVFTPSAIVDKMYDVFDEEFWKSAKTNKILDTASKSGNFAYRYVERALKYGLTLSDIKDNIYSIPTSPAAYEFTRKMYDALGLNIDNIAQGFTSYDLLELEHPRSMLSIDKQFSNISKQDLVINDKIETDESEGDKVKFAAIVGNPPYDDRTDTNFAKSIYNDFFDSAIELRPDLICMIHPAKFLFNSGATPKSWNKKMLNDPHLSIEMYEPDMRKIFPSTGAKGGICVTFWDKNRTDSGLGGMFIAYEDLRGILKKIPEGGFDKIVGSRGETKTTTPLDKKYPNDLRIAPNFFDRFPDVFTKVPNTDRSISILGLEKGNKRTKRYVDSDIINDPKLNSWKVFIAKSNGSGTFGETLSAPFVAAPLVVCTYSFLQVGSFSTEIEAENCLKYLKTKLCRAMLGTRKVTQDNPKSTWRNVPIQDFTVNSDIDWSKTIDDIDKQLYVKYSLDETEINFIETNVRAME